MKIEIYSAAIYLLKASKLLYRYDKKNSENLLNLSEKYLLDLENKNLKKEINFILRVRNKILPVEAKLNFARFNPATINYFNEKYGIRNYKVIGLNGEPKNNFCVYPWEI